MRRRPVTKSHAGIGMGDKSSDQPLLWEDHRERQQQRRTRRRMRRSSVPSEPVRVVHSDLGARRRQHAGEVVDEEVAGAPLLIPARFPNMYRREHVEEEVQELRVGERRT